MRRTLLRIGCISLALAMLLPSMVSGAQDATVLGTVPPNLQFEIPAGLPSPLPTNRWWSSGILEPWPSPLYAWPLTARMNDAGVTLDAPGRRVENKTVFADARSPIRVFAPDQTLSRAVPLAEGDWDVTFRLRGASGNAVMDLSMAEGSPYAFFRSYASRLAIAFPAGTSFAYVTCPGCSAFLAQANGVRYLVTVGNGVSLVPSGAELRVDFPGSGLLSVAVLAPDSYVGDFVVSALSPVTGTRADYSVDAKQVKTTFRFTKPTLFGLFPHQWATLLQAPSGVLGTYETLRGPVKLYKGQSFVTSLSRPALRTLPSIGSDPSIRLQLAADIQEDRPLAGDVYGAAKDILRKALMISVAESIGDRGLRDQAASQVRRHLADWCTYTPGKAKDYFAYDSRAGGIIAIPPAFASEKYNDHHFHYGYFIEAAAILSEVDPSFAQQYGRCIRALIRDIAAERRDPAFPYLRNFDSYAGHSWANGLALTGDGNNQESTSEAIQAWYGVARYGRAIGDRTLENWGTWLYAQEIHAARVYWLNVNPSLQALPPTFPFPIISILWGGKADHLTFFDPSDAAITGIQFFPVTPALLPYVNQSLISRVVTPVAVAAETGIWKTGLDLVRSAVEPVALALDAPLDPVYSRSYVEAWRRAFGN